MGVEPDLTAAAAAVEATRALVDTGFRTLSGVDDLDSEQVVAYDLAHAAAAVETARALLDYGQQHHAEARIKCAFVDDVVYAVATRGLGRDERCGASLDSLESVWSFLSTSRSPEFLSDLCGEEGP